MPRRPTRSAIERAVHQLALLGRQAPGERTRRGSTRGQQTPPHPAAPVWRVNRARIAWTCGSPNSATLGRTRPAVLKLLRPPGRAGSNSVSGIGLDKRFPAARGRRREDQERVGVTRGVTWSPCLGHSGCPPARNEAVRRLADGAQSRQPLPGGVLPAGATVTICTRRGGQRRLPPNHPTASTRALAVSSASRSPAVDFALGALSSGRDKG